MSYFFATVNDSGSQVAKLKRLFEKLGLSATTIEISCTAASVVVYAQSKVIKDIFVQDAQTNSWLLLIGTPLINDASDHGLQILLEKFLASYTKTLVNDIDGHFCLFAYDGRREIFVTATDFNNFVPVFYAAVHNQWLFSSSELILAKLLQSGLAPLGVSQAIHLGSTWDATTRFNDILKTTACELITIDKTNKCYGSRYWEPSAATVWQEPFDAALHKWMSLLRDSVLAFYSNATVQDTVWTDFTGGEDARLILAQCHALGLPYRARVGGFGRADIDVASRAARQCGVNLTIDPYRHTNETQVLEHYKDIALSTDAYGSFFYGCTRFATNASSRPLVFDYLHFSGVPGGEAFRGTYYARAKLLFPAKNGCIDHRFFTKLKYLLNYQPELTRYPDAEFLAAVYESVRASLAAVEDFPVGLQVDHLLREFQTCVRGLHIKRPFYLPLGLRRMTASIYNVSPRFKRGGRLTKASTELLFPALAFTTTVNHIPTVRRSPTRIHLFLPEYYALMRKATLGFSRRVMHWQQASKTLSPHHRPDIHGSAMMTVLNCKPLADYFRSPNSMVTGELYSKPALNELLDNARHGKCSYVEVLGRIINQELAARYVYEW